MYTIWIFLVLTQGHTIEVGGFVSEEECNVARKEVVVQREAINKEKSYIIAEYLGTTKCIQVHKK